MPISDLLIVVLSLSASGAWLVYKLDGFKWMRKVNDEKGIIIPSFLFLMSPFLAMYAISVISHGNISEMIKPLIPVVTFVLGQTISKREKQKESKKGEIELAKILIFKVGKVVRSLSYIEASLMSIKDDDQLTYSRVISCCEKYESELDNLYEKTSSQLEVLKTNQGIRALDFIGKIRDDIARLASIQLEPQHRLGELGDIRLYQVEGYENIIALIKESIPPSESIHDDLLNECVFKLEQERERLLGLRKGKQVYLDYYSRNPDIDLKEYPEINLYSKYDIDTECDAIQAIEKIFRQLKIQVTTVDFNSHIDDFNMRIK